MSADERFQGWIKDGALTAPSSDVLDFIKAAVAAKPQIAWLKSTIVSILVLANRGVSTNDIRDICQHTLDKQMNLEK